jgi:polyhydroxybutyrate depolymerase
MRNIYLAISIFFALILETFAQSNIIDSFTYQGITRHYNIYVPAIYNSNNAVPLLLNLHGYGSNKEQQSLYGNFKPIADTANFIIIHPDGTPDLSSNLFWNSFGASTIDDVGFLSALIDTISSQYNINSNRIYSTGMSNGGFMSYDLACFLSNKITAIASVTGTMTLQRLNNCNPNRPIPVMQIHGTNDLTVPYNGNTTMAAIQNVVNFWVNHNNCNPTPQTIQIPNTNTTDNSTAERFLYTGGTNNSTVELFKVQNGGHTWPGFSLDVGGVTNRDFSASTEIWRFFSQYSLDNLTSTNLDFEKNIFEIFPNPSSEKFTLKFENNDSKIIEIRNFTGQLIQKIETSELQTEISLKENGIYFISFFQNQSITTKKIIKK